MYYINTVIDFLSKYSVIVLPVCFAIVFLYGFANWIANPYRKQNKKLVAIRKGVASYPDRVGTYAERLPQPYRRQWRASQVCKAKPALTFEFVAKSKRPHLLWLLLIAAMVSSAYVAVFVLKQRYVSYLLFQGVFLAAFGLVSVANSAVANRQLKKARLTFARTVTQINRCTPYQGKGVETTVKQLQRLNRHEVNDVVIGKASQLLRNKGLEQDRTVDEQRKLNSALNSLLQSYSRNSRNSRLAGEATK